MTNLITSYIIQTGECMLPGIGSFTMLHQPARHEVAGLELKAPVSSFHFSENNEPLSKSFIRYIATKTGVDELKAAEAIHLWCKRSKARAEAGQAIFLPALGSLQKDSNNTMTFTPDEDLVLFETVPAVRVVHKDESHPVLVGDRESNTSEMNALLSGESAEKTKLAWWKVAAMVLLVAGIGFLCYHLYTTDSSHILGNKSAIDPEMPPKTYIAR